MCEGNPTHLSIDHVGHHHDLIALRVWELQRQFGRLYVEGQNNGVLKRRRTDALLSHNKRAILCCTMINKARRTGRSTRSSLRTISGG